MRKTRQELTQDISDLKDHFASLATKVRYLGERVEKLEPPKPTYKVEVKCKHCGHKNVLHIEKGSHIINHYGNVVISGDYIKCKNCECNL